MSDWHIPVLVREVLECLIDRRDGRYVDGTTGTGGHAEAILQVLLPTGRLACVDQDPDCLDIARKRLGDQGDRVHFHRGSFSALDAVLRVEGWDQVDGILLDLGLNSWSLSQPAKGLSYQIEGPLSMVLDPDLRFSAADLLARCDEEELARILAEFGEVRRPRLFARRAVAARQVHPLRTTADLVLAFSGGRPGGVAPGELSRLFQALRVAVCREMERLDEFLDRCGDWIRPGGRLVIMSYASHEDRRVKRLAAPGGRSEGAFRPLFKSPLRPGAEELRGNRRARSAKLRCFQRGDV